MIYKVAIIGYSEGNGHPYSFSAIINGFSKKKLINYKKSSWKLIDNYLLKTNITKPLNSKFKVTNINFGGKNFKSLSHEISLKFGVDNIFKKNIFLVKNIDLIIVAHDNFKKRNFFERKIKGIFKGPLFFDKALDKSNSALLNKCKLIKNGKIWSASGCRFTNSFNKYVKLIIDKKEIFTFLIPNSWKSYGIHVLEFLYSKNIIKLKDSVLIKKKKINYAIFRNNVYIGSIILKNGYKKISLKIKNNNYLHLKDNLASFSSMIRILFDSYNFKKKILNIDKKNKQISINSNILLNNLKI